MSYDQKNYDTEWERRINEHDIRVRRMADEELMSIYEKIYDNPDKEDAALVVASYNEVHRRFVAAGWFWKRWLNGQEYEKWNNFIARIEAKATKFALEEIQKLK